VFRRDDLSRDKAENIVRAAKRYLHQKYRFSAYVLGTAPKLKPKKEDTTQFCSRLVAHAYAAAGMPMTKLPQNRVLPIDLYKNCQSSPWRNVTDEFSGTGWPQSNDGGLGPIEIPGLGKFSISELFELTDKLIETGARQAKQTEELFLKNYDDILRSEALLAKYCSAQLDLAKAIRLKPDILDDASASAIARVLEQIEALLDLSSMPSLDAIIAETPIYSAGSGENISTYAGRPVPSDLRKLQHGTETLRLLSYFLFAETGLFVIAAHATGNEKFTSFKVVRREFAELFFAALKHVPELSEYENNSAPGFVWMQNDRDRASCRTMWRNILLCLKVVDFFRAHGGKWLT
jgi:hypothetical protein